MPTMLPALPKSFGILKDVFISALGSITGENNRLQLNSTKQAVCVLVDGLGSANLKAAGGHATFLNAVLAKQGSIGCGFPSTTATSITSFATGLDPAKHGFVGYRVFDRENELDLNLLTGWNSTTRGEDFQPATTVSELATSAGVAVNVIGPGEYDRSGFTMATMRSAKYHAARSISDRFEVAQKILVKGDTSLTYLYIPELDQAAHAFGSNSAKWLNLVEELDSQMRRFTLSLKSGSGLLLTADHGIVDVPAHKQWFLDESGIDDYRLRLVAGDPRVSYIYFDAEPETRIASAQTMLEDWFGANAWVLNRNQLVEAFFKGATTDSLQRLPDLAILAKSEIAIYHRKFAKVKSLQMIGQHGSISAKELNVPLLKFADFA